MEQRLNKLRLLAAAWEPKKIPAADLTDWRSKLSLEKIEILYILGLGSAYNHLQDWLKRDAKRRLIFLEQDGGNIACAVAEEHPLLQDPQVELEWLPPEHEPLLQELAERYPAKAIEVVALPGQDAETIRLELLRKTTLSNALHQDRLHGYQPFENFVQNIAHLKDAFYANGLRNAFKNIPAIICGAGPSLQQALPLLAELEGRALIIAAGSAIAALSAAGIEPHFAVAIDPNLEEYRRFKNSFAFDCPLLISTRVFPGIFSTCNGPIGYLRSGIGGIPELWLEEELKLTDPLLGEHLSEESISVAPICAAYAQLLGCSTILLAGVDLAYTDGKRYAENVSTETAELREIEAEKSVSDRILYRADKQGRSVATAVRWLMEASSLSHYASKHHEIQWINTTEGGLPISHFENLPLYRSVERFCTVQTDLRGRIAREIALHPMPNPTGKLTELKESLDRLIDHLQILTGEKKGSTALAEVELQDELATSILFYDIERLLPKESRWEFYLDLARKYQTRLG